MTSRSFPVFSVVRPAVLEVTLFLLGMLFVRREIWQLHTATFAVIYWQQGVMLWLAALDGAVTGAFSARALNVENTPSYKGILRFGTPLFFFLYVGCAALSERLVIGVFPTAIHEFTRTLGVVLVIAGIGVRIWAYRSHPYQLMPGAGNESLSEDMLSKSESATSPAKSSNTESTTFGEGVTEIMPAGPHRLLRHPDASGKLLALCGIPLAFNSWLPLLALPGIIILLKWHISDQEAFRISQLGEPYLEYRKRSWNLIPYLY